MLGVHKAFVIVPSALGRLRAPQYWREISERTMKSGSYHRIGKYDIWYGYQGTDTNYLRIEWLGEGMKVLNAKLVEDTIIKTDEDYVLKLFAKTKNGTITITQSNSGNITIQIKWWFIPIFWGSGKESAYKDESLINKICSTNKI